MTGYVMFVDDPRYKKTNNPNNGTVTHNGGHRPYCNATIDVATGQRKHLDDCQWPDELGIPTWLTPQGVSIDPKQAEIDALTADLAERQAKLASLQGNNPVQSEIQVQNQNPPTIVGQNQPVVNQPVQNQPTVNRNNRRELELIPMVGRNGYTEIPNSLGFSFKIQTGHNASKDSPRYYAYGTAIAGQSATGDVILGMNFNVNKQNANVVENCDVIVVPTGSVVTVNGNVIQ